MKGCVLLSQLLKTQFYIGLPDCTLVLSFLHFYPISDCMNGY